MFARCFDVFYSIDPVSVNVCFGPSYEPEAMLIEGRPRFWEAIEIDRIGPAIQNRRFAAR
jgi:hypothetical protein